MRINICKAFVRDETAFAKKEPNLTGFVLMGPPQRRKFTRSYGKKEPACKKARKSDTAAARASEQLFKYNERVLQSTHEQPQIHWHSTCVAAFIADLGVQVLPPLQNMHKVDPWRCTQRFLVRLGELQNDSWLLVHNEGWRG